jgi:hypothetical protein
VDPDRGSALIVAQADDGAAAVLIVVWLAFAVFLFASLWKVFTKAGQPGWAAIVPIYNIIVWLRIIGRPWWWILLLVIPIVNIVVLFIVSIDLAKSFGRSTAFGVGLALSASCSSRSSRGDRRPTRDPRRRRPARWRRRRVSHRWRRP